MARNAIESEFRTFKMADRSEMARNGIEREFQTFKIVYTQTLIMLHGLLRTGRDVTNVAGVLIYC